MSECIFCEIAKGLEPAYKVWEDERHLAFLSVPAKKAGHTLVIPKFHVDNYLDMEDGAFDDLMAASKIVAIMLRRAAYSKRVVLKIVGVEVAHVHVHLLPSSFENKGADMKAIAELIEKTNFD